MSARYPGYDVLAKRHTPSWNEKTRRVIDERLAVSREPRFFVETEFQTLEAICARIIPQPVSRPPVPIAALLDNKMVQGHGDGHRDARLPPMAEAWRRGLAALDAEARHTKNASFHALAGTEQDALLKAAQDGQLTGGEWLGMESQLFFAKRLLFDIVTAYYGHPTAWNEIGFGGPASPRGYVRMDFDRRDPWEAVEEKEEQEEKAIKANVRIG